MAYKILCIDESGLTRLDLSRRLKDLSVTVINAKDRAGIQNALELNYFTLFVCTINSGAFKEFDYVKELKLRPEYRETPVIVISQFTDRKCILRAVELGAQEYIIKPYDEEVLANKICGVLGVQQPRTSLSGMLEEDIITFNFSEMFNKEVKAASRGAYAMSILFGAISNTVFPKGNENVLREITMNLYRAIKTKLRDTDSIFYEGNGKIAIILPFADQSGLRVVDERVKNIFEHHSLIKPYTLEYRFITGSASFPEDGKIQHNLLEKAKHNLDMNTKKAHQNIS